MTAGYQRRERVELLCAECGDAFRGRPNALYCGSTCADRVGRRSRQKSKTCLTCGAMFTTDVGRYCSLACRPLQAGVPVRRAAKAESARERAGLAAIALARRFAERAGPIATLRVASIATCECGVTFRRWASNQRFCGKTCKNRHHSTAHGPIAHSCVRCGESFESRSPIARYCSNACRRSAGKRFPAESARRRAAKKVRRLRPIILDRHGWVCYLCEQPITRGFADPHPGGATLDHVVPIAQGGRDDESNLRPAHRHCNEDKGERYPAWWELRLAGVA